MKIHSQTLKIQIKSHLFHKGTQMSLNFTVISQVKIQNKICAKRKISHQPGWQNKMALKSRRRQKQRSRFDGRVAERKRERWENSGKVKQMALAFDFPDGCPDWWAQWHRVVSLTCCLHRLPIRRSLSRSRSLSRLSDAPPGHRSPTWPLWFQPAAAVYPISVTRRNCTWHLLFKEAKAITIARPDCSHH